MRRIDMPWNRPLSICGLVLVGLGMPSVVMAQEQTGAMPDFVKIEAGTFTQGSVEAREDPRLWPLRINYHTPDTEETALLRSTLPSLGRAVTITYHFWLQTTPLTQAQWREQMGNNPGEALAGADRPVTQVSWLDAVAYANALSQSQGVESCYRLIGCTGTPGAGDFQCQSVRFRGVSCQGYRLPTEAEWSYAARAGTTARRSAEELQEIAWYGQDRDDWIPPPVGQKSPNAWGLYDTLGYVKEWTHDWVHQHGSEAQVDPVGPTRGSLRAKKGCSWHERSCYVARRSGKEPTYRSEDLGFRLARTFVEGQPPIWRPVDAKEAERLFRSATLKLAARDISGAQNDCFLAIRGGNTDCHYILGIINSQRGEKAQACEHFRQAPDNPRIRTWMARLECPPSPGR